MKKFFLLTFFFISYYSGFTQAPAIVKAVESTVLKPGNDAQNKWQNCTWNGMVFYQGTGSPAKLCVTDGTSSGTRFVKDLGAGGFHAVLPAKDFVYIVTSQLISFSPFTYSYEIWRSDGTVAGTSQVYALPNAIGLSNGGQFFSDRQATYNFCLDGTTNILYFGQYDAANGNELWRTDGTNAGTFLLKDIKPGSGGSFPWGFCKIGNEVFFNATEISFERKLWKTDGTTAGTVQVPVAEPFFVVDGAITRLNNKMIFFAHNTVDGYEPYVSDGTAAGTFMLGNINPAGNSQLAFVDEANLKSNSKHSFLILNNGTDTSLYRTDGTVAGTIRLAPAGTNIQTNLSSGGYSDVDENGIWVVKYNSSGSGNSEKIYRSNGTAAGTYLVAENIMLGQKVKSYKGALWFQARDIGSFANAEPWRCGGNEATTNKAFEIEPAVVPVTPFTPYSSTPYGFFTLGNDLFFWASTSLPSGHNLYKYTGDFTYNGNSPSALWKDSANWNSGMPPGITDSVFIPAGTPYPMNVFQGNGYAGVLTLQAGLMATISSSTDTLFVNDAVISQLSPPLSKPMLTGGGYLALRSSSQDTVRIYNGINTNGLLIFSNSVLHNGNVGIGLFLTMKKARLVLGNNNLSLDVFGTMTGDSTSFVVTNGTGVLSMSEMGGVRSGPQSFFVGTGSSQYGYELQLENTGTNDVLNVRAADNIYSAYSGESPAGPAYGTGAVNTTFFINEQVAGGSNVNMLMKWFHPSQQLPGFDLNNVHLGHYTAGAWNLGTSGPAVVNGNSWSYSRSGITSFSPFGILNASAGTLPLQFLSFTARKSGSNVLITWQTVNEQQVSYFEVQRSTDGRSFSNLHHQDAQNQAFNQYNYTDDIGTINGGTLYYRIKQADADGRTAWSTIQVIRMADKQLVVYPNPVKEVIHIINGQLVSKATLSDMNGRTVKQWNTVNGSIGIEDMQPGVYLLSLQLQDRTTETFRIIKL